MTKEEFHKHIEVGKTLGIPEHEFRSACEDLFFWQYANGDNFTSLLFHLFQKADPSNLRKLGRGFPAHFMAHRVWGKCDSQDEFFELAGVGFRKDKSNG